MARVDPLDHDRAAPAPGCGRFLGFLGATLVGRDRPGHSPQDAAEPAWTRWWAAYQDQDGRLPLHRPSSEIVDQVGRLLEDAQRDAAFRS